MAIPILNHMDFQKSAEIRNVRLHNQASSGVTSPGTGQIIYDSGTIKFYNGSAWVSLGTSNATGDITAVNITAGAGLSGSVNTSSGDHTQTVAIDLSEFSAVTPASGDSFLTLDSDGSTEQLTTVSALQSYMQSNLSFTSDTNLTEEEVEDFVGGMVTGNTETGITVTYEDSDGTLDFVVANSDFALTGDVTGSATQTAKGNVSIAATIAADAVHASMINDDLISGSASALTSGLASTDEFLISDAGTLKNMDVSVLQSYMQSNLTFTTDTNTDVDVSNANLLTRLAALESSSGSADENITIGADSGDTIVITGNLQVSGTTTTVNSTTVNLNDHNIVLDSGNSTSAVVDGAGITLEGGSGDDATFTYNASTNAFDFKLGSSFEDIKAAKFTGTELDISGDVDIDGTLEADAITVNGSTLQVVVEDHVGAMLDGTETGISVSYDSSNNNLDFVVSDTTVAGDSGSTGITPGDTLTIAGGTNVTTAMSGDTLTITATDTNTQLSFASAAEVQAGTNTAKAVNPDVLAAKSVHATIDVSDSDFSSNLYAEITHSLGTEDVIVQLFDSSSKEQVYADIARTDKSNSASTSKIKITFAAAPSNDIEVLITSIKGSTAGSVAYA